MGAASSRCVACLIGEGANVRLAKTQSAGKHSAVGVTFLVNVSPAWDTDSTTGVATACAVGVDGLDGDLACKADLSTSSCHTASNALEILPTRLPLREPHFLKAKGELGGCVMYLLFRYTGLPVGVIRPQSRSTDYWGRESDVCMGLWDLRVSPPPAFHTPTHLGNCPGVNIRDIRIKGLCMAGSLYR